MLYNISDLVLNALKGNLLMQVFFQILDTKIYCEIPIVFILVFLKL